MLIVPVVNEPPIEIVPVVIPVFHNAAVPVVVKDVFTVSIVGVVIVGDEPVIRVPVVGNVNVVAPEVVNIKELPVVDKGTVYLVVDGE